MRPYFSFLAAFLLAVSPSASILAGVIVVPNSATTVEGNNNSSPGNALLGTGQFSNLFFIAASELSTIPIGNSITGFTVRANGTQLGSFPTSTLTWSNYDVYLGAPASGLTISSFGTTSGTPLSYFDAPNLVRSGSLSVSTASFQPSGLGPNPFGAMISLGSGYVYLGGDLMFYVTHGTATGTGFQVDATSTDFGFTPTSKFAQRTAFTYNPNSIAATVAAPVVEFQFSPVFSAPEPSSLAVFAIVGIACFVVSRANAAVFVKKRARQ